MFRTGLLIQLGIISSALALTQLDPISISSGSFRDPQNRDRFFHGVAISIQTPPYLPTTDHFDPNSSLSSSDLTNLIEWGFNLVRLTIPWESIETAPNQYNLTQIQEIEALLNRMGEAGIYTLIDTHMDLLEGSGCVAGVLVKSEMQGCNY
ncbi:hypothetical protein FGO68_gene3098 [Halteria grandinella]|uniref:Glycoside hydrolase family 5 domain-containing protein n=1 Tax=Halteria grandinella TaxID=5974 RepID=A0A8J8T238_HALGN|nr:hypothetical protein FGO68_gene3098 [Halteria grandinella]